MASPRRPAVALALLLLGLFLGWLVREVTEVPGVPAPSGVRDAAPLTRAKPASGKDRLRRENAALRDRIAAMEAPAARPPEEPTAPVVPPSPATRILEPAVKLAGESGDPDAATLRVLVRDSEGRPQGGIKVGTWFVWNSQARDRRDAVTGPAGTVEFQGLPAGDRRVAMDVLQGSRTVQAGLTGGRVTEVAFRVEGGVRVEGVVRDEGKGPMGGVSLSLARHDGPVETWLHATSDGGGRYRFESVSPGPWKARLEGGAIAYSSRVEAEVEMPESGPVARDFIVGVPTVSGTVLDRASRRPLPAATVSISGRLYRSATTDSAGAYRFLDLPAGKYLVAVSRDGYATEHLGELTVPPNGQRIDAELPPASALSIVVTDPSGQPYAGDLDLMITAVGGKGSSGADLRTNAEGRASYNRILPGRYELRFEAGGIGEASLEVVLVPGDNSLDVRLQRK